MTRRLPIFNALLLPLAALMVDPMPDLHFHAIPSLAAW